MVFQHYALFPHMTVEQNVAFGLTRAGTPSRERRRRRVAEALAPSDLVGFERRLVTELSGGQQQRVALARALGARAARPAARRAALQPRPDASGEDAPRAQSGSSGRVGITTLFVTHEQEEAFDIGDRVAVLNVGRIEQVGTPEKLYDAPARGSSRRSSGGRAFSRERGRRSRVPSALPAGASWRAVAPEGILPGAPADLVVRPEGLAFSAPGNPEALAGRVMGRRFAGTSRLFRNRPGRRRVGRSDRGAPRRLCRATGSSSPRRPRGRCRGRSRGRRHA